MKPIAVQLYTLRDAAAKDFPGVLRRVADIGYKGVEPAGLHGYDPKEIARIVSDLGMEICSSHTALPADDNVDQLAATEQALGNTLAITSSQPSYWETSDLGKANIAKYKRAVELLKARGMSFGFHNHYWEFEKLDGRCIFDTLMEEIPDMFSELDVYWSTYAKMNSPEVVSRYKSRIPILHLKDGTLEEGSPMTAVGDGKVPIEEVVAAADPNVLRWVVVELDRYDGDPFEAVEKSYKYLTSKGLGIGNK